MNRTTALLLGTLFLGPLALVRCGGDDSNGGAGSPGTGGASGGTGGGSPGSGGTTGTGIGTGGTGVGTGGTGIGTGGTGIGTGGTDIGTGGSSAGGTGGTGGSTGPDASAGGSAGGGTGGASGSGGSAGTAGQGTGDSSVIDAGNNNGPSICPGTQPTDGTSCTRAPADAGPGANACSYSAPVEGGLATTTCACALAAERNDAGMVVRNDAGAIVQVAQWNCGNPVVTDRNTCPAAPVANNGNCNVFVVGLVCPGVGGRTCTCDAPTADAGAGAAQRWSCVLPNDAGGG